MIQGLYVAATGMMANESRHAAIANNIANAATPGFKSQNPVQLGFYEVFSKKLRHPFIFNRDSAPAGGVKVVETYPDLASGVVRATDNPLNLAINGPGFFAIDTPRGERYTRSGEFTIDAGGQLATLAGDKVQSISGQPIDVRGSQVSIGQDGMVSVDGTPAGQIRLVEFEEPTRLMREGSSLYSASEEVAYRSADAVDTTVRQNYLEMSNVNLPGQMVGMMTGMRAYEANQRVIQTIDATMGRLIEQVGMPG